MSMTGLHDWFTDVNSSQCKLINSIISYYTSASECSCRLRAGGAVL